MKDPIDRLKNHLVSSLLHDPDKGVSCSYPTVVWELSFVRIRKAMDIRILLLDRPAAAGLHTQCLGVCSSVRGPHRPTLATPLLSVKKILRAHWALELLSLLDLLLYSIWRKRGVAGQGQKNGWSYLGETASPLRDGCSCMLQEEAVSQKASPGTGRSGGREEFHAQMRWVRGSCRNGVQGKLF